MTHCFLGLGSNMGDRAHFIEQTVKLLGAHPQITIERTSSLIETKAVGEVRQPNFLNTAVQIDTTLSTQELLKVTQHIEQELGRIRERNWGPRTIDIDILLYGDMTIIEKDLVIPHPRLEDRPFVLRSLTEIAPDMVHPRLNRTMVELLENTMKDIDMFTIRTNSPEETKQLAAQLARALPSPYVLTFSGDLGAGKTTFIQGFCAGLAVKETVHSPSFTLLNIYNGELPVYHIDFYRLNSESEIELLGIDEYLPPEQGFTLIEWANNAPHLLPKQRLILDLKDLGENTREISFSAAGDTAGLLKELRAVLAREKKAPTPC